MNSSPEQNILGVLTGIAIGSGFVTVALYPVELLVATLTNTEFDGARIAAGTYVTVAIVLLAVSATASFMYGLEEDRRNKGK